MGSPTLARQATTATSLVQDAFRDICFREKDEAEFHSLHMDWALIADTRGNPRPLMHWLAD